MISTSDSAADVAQRVEEQAGLPHGGRLLLNGVEVAPSSSLASYGVRAGAVLELVPHELGPPAALPPGSPLLSSPQHELVRCIGYRIKYVTQSGNYLLTVFSGVSLCFAINILH